MKTEMNRVSSFGSGVCWLVGLALAVVVAACALGASAAGAQQAYAAEGASLQSASSALTAPDYLAAQAKRWNKAYINVSSGKNAQGKAVTLKGRLKRINYTPSKTGMAWGCAVTYLVFDKPVKIKYNGFNGDPVVKKYKKIQVGIDVAWVAAGDEYKANHPSKIKGCFDKYLGKVKKVRGRIFDAGTAYYFGDGRGGGSMSGSKIVK